MGVRKNPIWIILVGGCRYNIELPHQHHSEGDGSSVVGRGRVGEARAGFFPMALEGQFDQAV